MRVTEPQPAAPEPKRRGLQYSLTTLLLLFAVLGSSLAVFGVWGIVVVTLVVGLAVYVYQVRSWRTLTYLGLGVLCLVCLIGLLLVPAVHSGREAACRLRCSNNLKEIALGVLNYEAAHHCFPPTYIADKNGKPMHSWRVLILPYPGCGSLHDYYQAYDFADPWDGAKNKKLLAERPTEYCAEAREYYACPGNRTATAPSATQTSYVAVVGPNTGWARARSKKLGDADWTGWARKTVMLVEVANSGIQWTEPRDLSLDDLGAGGTRSPLLAVSSNHHHGDDFFFAYNRCGAHVAMVDGSVHYLPPRCLSAERLRKMLQVGGYNEDEVGSDDALYDDGRRLNWPNIAALAVWVLSVGALLFRAVRSRKTRQGLPLAATSNMP
jgi:hypothetical protein